MRSFFKYSNTIKTIYPSDPLALSNLPVRIGKDLESEYKCKYRVVENQVQFENTIYYEFFSLFKRHFHMAIDSGSITISHDSNDKIQFTYELRFFSRCMLLCGFAMLFSLFTSFNIFYMLPLALLIQVVNLAISIQSLKGIISDALKNRYR